ncbi:hypothetical protein HU200_041376 [Digitaria exilis]|uniref:Leucine-rich repeat-containing N-terminal plant-type domain-containing protein n=1 Tax=Digitaria exilis TaxID=1010633 RepID=A0A835B771_9POAL|nr:hypothetical protein HU200_041376 [Digitaria exilis]
MLVLNASILLSAKACDSSDLAALLKIKKQLGNPPDLSKWLANTDCCTWLQGLQCSETDGRVNLVSLFDMNVTAPVPSALGDLPMLETIQLRRIPGLYGSIPSTLDKLSRLVLLEISDSSVSGPIPEFLLKMNLSALAITNSKLTGSIPQFLSHLPNLRYINLSGNKLTGSIPPGLLHASFRVLILSNNHLTGEIPEGYGNDDIDTIDLSHNQLTGDPSFLFGTTKPTTKIDLSWNMLEFDMTQVRFPYHMTYLDLSHNHIKGEVAKSLRDINLEYFNVSYKQHEIHFQATNNSVTGISSMQVKPSNLYPQKGQLIRVGSDGLVEEEPAERASPVAISARR